MRIRLHKVLAVMAAMLIAAVCAVTQAAALDDQYRFDDFGMSLKVPKSYEVITRDTKRGDEVFAQNSLDYDEIMTAFKAANIYMRAYAPDEGFQISLTVTGDENTKTINNYSDLSSAERKAIVDVLLTDGSVSSAVEVKHGGNIFFDSARETAVEGKTVYISQCNTVINGWQIDLTLQKNDEAILPDEAKTLTNIASSMDFDKIVLKNNGPVFEWWRLLLWIAILVGISVACSFIYKQYNAANRRRLEERRSRRTAAADAAQTDGDDRGITFEEALGYADSAEFGSRADTDLDSFDINVREKDPTKGVSYFEDGGDGIDDRTDYFDTYFKSPTERRSASARAVSTIGAYLGIFFKHLRYFFKNLFRTVFGKNR